MHSVTVVYLARALDRRWAGRRVQAVTFDRTVRSVAIAVEGSPPLDFPLAGEQLAPRELVEPPPDTLHVAGWRLVSVTAPTDERRLTVRFEREGKFRGSPTRSAVLDVSFIPTARGARLHGDPGDSRIGARLPAVAEPRPVLAATEIARAVRAGDRAALLRGRWMHPSVIAWLGPLPERAAERYRALDALPEEPPMPLDPLWLPAGAGAPRFASGSAPPIVDDHRARAIARMERELRSAADAPRRRAAARALLALGDAPAPATIAHDDGLLPIDPRPGERAAKAAERLHAEASAMERALATLPARIVAMRSTPLAAPPPSRETPARRSAPRAARPFREYRSSGGLDIWVGRGAASNDRLTFHESAPGDVWLHARDAAGAHVVLRWSRDDPPPARDLAEAAALAAWHSKARGSTVAPVDWTRRKHVRKPRGGPPGLVLVDRVKTVNARPSAQLERRLRRAE